MDGEPLFARPDLDDVGGCGDLDDLAGPGPAHAVVAVLPLHKPVAADLAVLAEKRRQPRRRQHWPKQIALLDQPIDRPLPRRAMNPDVGDTVCPSAGLNIEIIVVRKACRRPEIAFHVADADFDPSLGLRTIRSAKLRVEPQAEREIQEARIPNRCPNRVPIQNHHFGVVVQAAPWYAAETLEGVDVAAQEVGHVGAPNELHVQRARPAQNEGKAPNGSRPAGRQCVAKYAEVDLCLFAGFGLVAHRRGLAAPRTEWLEVVLEDRVAAGVPARSKLPHQDDGILQSVTEAFVQVGPIGIEL